MAVEPGTTEIPSYKNVVAGEPNGSGIHREPNENSKDVPVMGNQRQTRLGGRCLPRSQKKPRFVICKFVGFWPSERDLAKWIQQRWKPKGHIDLKLGEKGFFTVIFSILEDKEIIFEGGPYFMNNSILFMRHWEDCYNPNHENMLAAPIWVRLFGLPMEFWDPDILEGIGNTIRTFTK